MLPSPPSLAATPVKLDIQRKTLRDFRRIIPAHHSATPLGFDRTAPSRFSDPRTPANFGVVYLGQTLKVCFVEAILRDHAVGQPGPYPMVESEITGRAVTVVGSTSPLLLVNLRGDGLVRMRLPTDMAKAADHALGRWYSVLLHDHPDKPDGLIYDSRINGGISVAIYERALSKLMASSPHALVADAALASILDRYAVALV